jgi:ABC-type multidrug transport system fused ATPase/permease subunit
VTTVAHGDDRPAASQRQGRGAAPASQRGAVPPGLPREPDGAGADWTDERGASEEGRRRHKGRPEASRENRASGKTEPAVVCAGLTYRFGDHVAVGGVDLEIRQGETFGLLGPNGAGKTTTIRMLTTLLKPAAGRVIVFGVDAAARPMLVRRMIGYVPQLLSADGTLTGRENVELFARLFDVPRAQRAARVAAS